MADERDNFLRAHSLGLQAVSLKVSHALSGEEAHGDPKTLLTEARDELSRLAAELDGHLDARAAGGGEVAGQDVGDESTGSEPHLHGV